MTGRGGFQGRIDWKYRHEPFFAELEGLGLGSFAALTSRCLGQLVVEHRSSWVRTTEIAKTQYYIKTYDYPTWRDRRRGLGRNTALAPSRARREWQASLWLQEHGFAAAEVVAVGEARRLGILHRACLVSRAWPGRPLSELLPSMQPAERGELLTALRTTVDALHQLGFRDRNLDLRNLLAQRQEDGTWRLAKIDSPRFRLARANSGVDGLVRADRDRLHRSLLQHDVDVDLWA